MSKFTLNISAKASITVPAASLREAISIINGRFNIQLKESRESDYAYAWVVVDGEERPYELIEE